MTCDQRFYGKYRGTVINNIDPMQKCRLQVTTPDVSIIPSTWAMPCFPTGGPQTGFVSIPPIGAGVWVEFEGGDINYPIWVGTFFGSAAEVPALSRAVSPGLSGITMQTMAANGVVLNDTPGVGGVMLTTSFGATITMNATGVQISNGQGATIVMSGPTVSINGTALVVT